MPVNWAQSMRPTRGASSHTDPPMLTYVLIALSVIVTVASLAAGDHTESLLYRIGNIGYVEPDKIWSGQYWGLVTPIFIHGGWIHLFFDMVWLYQIGRLMEPALNQVVYLAIIAASAAVGSACEILISGSPGIGMSGVVYALFGVMWMGQGIVPAWRALATPQNMQYMVAWALFCVAATQFHLLNIANGAHGGGFLFGLCVGALFFTLRRRWLWAIPLALLIAASVMAVTWVPWSSDWDQWKATREFERAHYAQAIQWRKVSIEHGADEADAWNDISAAWDYIAGQDKKKGDMAAMRYAKAEASAAAQKAGPDDSQ